MCIVINLINRLHRPCNILGKVSVLNPLIDEELLTILYSSFLALLATGGTGSDWQWLPRRSFSINSEHSISEEKVVPLGLKKTFTFGVSTEEQWSFTSKCSDETLSAATNTFQPGVTITTNLLVAPNLSSKRHIKAFCWQYKGSHSRHYCPNFSFSKENNPKPTILLLLHNTLVHPPVLILPCMLSQTSSWRTKLFPLLCYQIPF